MVRTKNFSPSQLALFTALLISVAVGICFLFFNILWWHAVIATVCVFLCNYFIFREVLRRFVFRKIKLIYKLIYQTKASKREEMYYKHVLPQKSIQEVEQDVTAWANRRSEEIESLRFMEQYRKEFLQNFAHEIKTPIFAVQGYLNILSSGDIEDPDKIQEYIAKAEHNVDRMVHLVSDIDKISKLESGQQELERTDFIIQDVIKEVLHNLNLQIEGKKLQFGIKRGCESPVHVYADKEKIRQVIINLVTNAAKYASSIGEVTASVYKMDENQVLIEISDNGIGIAEEHLPRIFERFYRTDSGRSRNSGGTGLGLAICKHIIEAHGQTIHVRSKQGVGTTVGFTLAAKKTDLPTEKPEGKGLEKSARVTDIA
ncbi:two-component system, OmpR family, phosphate regulon sensor histidine kinase PhoR [Arachidicoccus rhizosphaerae]|uniref:histidine kinase n=1 Tax=Arachidicoccus rhizosphaerae TaxID=551991 RepID=A0A1H4AX83_9BACT|nr:HAMP domain-containing sensor histidine kinase [Arachidicoccus rhizosphaerae]SEA40456.1 two-component system, OmpR family, phosphate regulon sensor histidine kinase PhoR [Arachidicoccus rhizosphaerae]